MEDIQIEYFPNIGRSDFDLASKRIIDILRRYLKKSSNWVEVTSFSNSWVNFGSIHYNTAYCKDSLGFVHMRGIIKDGTIGNAVFTLPPGFRPSSVLYISTTSYGSSAPQNSIVRIGVDGVTSVLYGGNDWVTLDSITFYAG